MAALTGHESFVTSREMRLRETIDRLRDELAVEKLQHGRTRTRLKALHDEAKRLRQQVRWMEKKA